MRGKVRLRKPGIGRCVLILLVLSVPGGGQRQIGFLGKTITAVSRGQIEKRLTLLYRRESPLGYRQIRNAIDIDEDMAICLIDPPDNIPAELASGHKRFGTDVLWLEGNRALTIHQHVF